MIDVDEDGLVRALVVGMIESAEKFAPLRLIGPALLEEAAFAMATRAGYRETADLLRRVAEMLDRRADPRRQEGLTDG